MSYSVGNYTESDSRSWAIASDLRSIESEGGQVSVAAVGLGLLVVVLVLAGVVSAIVW